MMRLTYIGECVNFRDRYNLHKNHIKNEEYRNLNVSKHIFSCRNKFKASPIFLIDSDCIIKRKTYEDKFIELYQPALNR